MAALGCSSGDGRARHEGPEPPLPHPPLDLVRSRVQVALPAGEPTEGLERHDVQYFVTAPETRGAAGATGELRHPPWAGRPARDELFFRAAGAAGHLSGETRRRGALR